jgi:serine palmitoyltransferase
LGSYNYLGYADPDSPCIPSVLDSLDKYPVSTCSSRIDVGTTKLHAELEKVVAKFVGKPAAMIFGMGFGTNSSGIPALIGKGGLILSDSLNHASIVIGARLSGAKVEVFQHGDHEDLERAIRRAIVEGQPRTHRPWSKIVIMVEGIYSMEGEICDLPKIVALKKKYNVWFVCFDFMGILL